MTVSQNMTRAMHRRSYIKEIVSIICIVLASCFLSYSLFSPGGYCDLQKARMELRERQSSVRSLEIDVERRMENANAIGEDALKAGRAETLELLEKRAREYGYARDGEYIQRIPD